MLGKKSHLSAVRRTKWSFWWETKSQELKQNMDYGVLDPEVLEVPLFGTEMGSFALYIRQESRFVLPSF